MYLSSKHLESGETFQVAITTHSAYWCSSFQVSSSLATSDVLFNSSPVANTAGTAPLFYYMTIPQPHPLPGRVFGVSGTGVGSYQATFTIDPTKSGKFIRNEDGTLSMQGPWVVVGTGWWSTPIPFTVKTAKKAIEINDAQAQPEEFTPPDEYTEITATVTPVNFAAGEFIKENVRWTVEIQDEGGQTVTDPVSGTGDEIYYKWNGQLNKKDYVPDGVYTALIKAEYPLNGSPASAMSSDMNSVMTTSGNLLLAQATALPRKLSYVPEIAKIEFKNSLPMKHIPPGGSLVSAKETKGMYYDKTKKSNGTEPVAVICKSGAGKEKKKDSITFDVTLEFPKNTKLPGDTKYRLHAMDLESWLPPFFGDKVVDETTVIKKGTSGQYTWKDAKTLIELPVKRIKGSVWFIYPENYPEEKASYIVIPEDIFVLFKEPVGCMQGKNLRSDALQVACTVGAGIDSVNSPLFNRLDEMVFRYLEGNGFVYSPNVFSYIPLDGKFYLAQFLNPQPIHGNRLVGNCYDASALAIVCLDALGYKKEGVSRLPYLHVFAANNGFETHSIRSFGESNYACKVFGNHMFVIISQTNGAEHVMDPTITFANLPNFISCSYNLINYHNHLVRQGQVYRLNLPNNGRIQIIE